MTLKWEAVILSLYFGEKDTTLSHLDYYELNERPFRLKRAFCNLCYWERINQSIYLLPGPKDPPYVLNKSENEYYFFFYSLPKINFILMENARTGDRFVCKVIFLSINFLFFFFFSWLYPFYRVCFIFISVMLCGGFSNRLFCFQFNIIKHIFRQAEKPAKGWRLSRGWKAKDKLFVTTTRVCECMFDGFNLPSTKLE